MDKQITFNEEQQKRIKQIFLNDLLDNAKRFLKKNNRLSIRFITKILELDPNNVEASKLLKQCETKVDKNDKLQLILTNFIKIYYPSELKTFEIYWDNLSKNEDFMQGKKYTVPVYGWGFSEGNKDLALVIFEIIVHQMNKGIMEKSDWSNAKLENWVNKECKKIGAGKKLRDIIYKYFQNILYLK